MPPLARHLEELAAEALDLLLDGRAHVVRTHVRAGVLGRLDGREPRDASRRSSQQVRFVNHKITLFPFSSANHSDILENFIFELLVHFVKVLKRL